MGAELWPSLLPSVPKARYQENRHFFPDIFIHGAWKVRGLEGRRVPFPSFRSHCWCPLGSTSLCREGEKPGGLVFDTLVARQTGPMIEGTNINKIITVDRALKLKTWALTWWIWTQANGGVRHGEHAWKTFTTETTCEDGWWETSLEAQRLRLLTSTAEGMGLFPGQWSGN